MVSRSHASIRFSDSIRGSGTEVIDKACHLHLEGIICKRAGSPYRPGRGVDWLKVKCSKRQEFVIGGFTKSAGSRAHCGALLLGYFNHARKLIYAGRVGMGFNEAMLRALHEKLVKLVQVKSPYATLSSTSGDARDVSWVKPKLVAEIQFSNWTDEGLLRHPSFQGLREAKPAGTVVHEEPRSLSDVKPSQNGRKSPGARRHGASDPFSYTVVLDNQNKVKAIEGTEKLLEKADTLSPQAKAAIRSRLETDTLKKAFEQALRHLPDVLTRPGESWERTEVVDLGSKQILTLQKKYEYVGTEKVGDKTLDKITSKTTKAELKQDPDVVADLKLSRAT